MFPLHPSPTDFGDQQHVTAEVSVSAHGMADTQLTMVQFCLPAFWTKNPGAWFCQVEAQFHLCRITSQLARYYYVVFSLPMELVDDLSDIAAPPTDDAYDRFKAAFLRRTTEPESSRLHQLLNAEELGDRRPTQVLHRMQQPLGTRPS